MKKNKFNSKSIPRTSTEIDDKSLEAIKMLAEQNKDIFDQVFKYIKDHIRIAVPGENPNKYHQFIETSEIKKFFLIWCKKLYDRKISRSTIITLWSNNPESALIQILIDLKISREEYLERSISKFKLQFGSSKTYPILSMRGHIAGQIKEVIQPKKH